MAQRMSRMDKILSDIKKQFKKAIEKSHTKVKRKTRKK